MPRVIPSKELLEEQGRAAFMHAVALDEQALGQLSEEAARRVEATLEEIELTAQEAELLNAQAGSGNFKPEVAEVKLGYPGAEGEGLHFTVAVIDHPLNLKDWREVPCSFTPQEIAEIIQEISLSD